MAKINEPGESSSIFGSILSTGVSAGAIGYGGYRSWKKYQAAEGNLFSNLTRVINPIPKSAGTQIDSNLAILNLQNFTSAAVEHLKSSRSGSAVERIRNVLKPKKDATGKMLNFSLELVNVKDALRRATKSSDATGEITKLLLNDVATARTAQEAIENIIGKLEGNDSIYAKRIARQFASHLEVMQRRTIDGLQTEYGMMDFDRLFKPRPMPISGADLSTAARESIEGLSSELGIKATLKQSRRFGLEGSQLHVSLGRFGELKVPQAIAGKEGVVVHGSTQQTRYITGRFGLLDERGRLASTFNYEEWMLLRAKTELAPQLKAYEAVGKSKKYMQMHIREFQDKMREELEYSIRAEHMSAYDSPQQYERMRANKLSLFRLEDNEFKALDIHDVAALVEEGGIKTAEGGFRPLYPGMGNKSGISGSLSLSDPASYFALFPEAADTARKPSGMFRADTALNSAQKKANREYLNYFLGSEGGELFGGAAGSERAGLTPAWTLYVPEDRAADLHLQGLGFSPEGQFLGKESAFERLAKVKLRSYTTDALDPFGETGKLDPSKAVDGTWTMNEAYEEGTAFGIDPQTGSVESSRRAGRIRAAEYHPGDIRTGDHMKFWVEENLKEGPLQIRGSDKGMMIPTATDKLEEIIKKDIFGDIGGTYTWKGGTYEGEAIASQVVTFAGAMKKDRSLHWEQMFSATIKFTHDNMKKGRSIGWEAQYLLTDPRQVREDIRQAMLTSQPGHLDHNAGLKHLMPYIRSGGLNEEQVGLTLGQVPQIFKLESKEALEAVTGSLSEKEYERIGRGHVVGMGRYGVVDDILGGGAGKVSKMEPRFFELLGTGHLGEAGAALQKEIAARMTAARPELVGERDELTKMARSLIKPQEVPGALRADDMIRSDREILPNQSSYLNIKGKGAVYIPGRGELRSLSGRKTKFGPSTDTKFARAVEDVISGAGQLEKGEITSEVMDDRLSTLLDSTMREREAVVSGPGGFLRDELPGSARLKALLPTREMGLKPGVIGITESRAKKMFEDMSNLGLYQEGEIKDISDKFFSGGTVPGLGYRDPATSPHSNQIVGLKMVQGEDAAAYIDESVRSVRAGTGSYKDGAVMNLRMGPSIGWDSDVDGDTVSFMFGTADRELNTSALMQQHLDNPEAKKAYEEWAYRYQFLKGKTSPENVVNIGQFRAGGVLKLSTTDTKMVGALSSGLQEARAAINFNQGLTQAEKMDAHGWLTLAEKMPIAGKNIKIGQERKIHGAVNEMIWALKNADDVKFQEAMFQTLEGGSELNKAAFGGGFSIWDEATKQETKISGSNIPKNIGNIMNSLVQFRKTPEHGIAMNQIRKYEYGKAIWDPSKEGTKRNKITTEIAEAMLDPHGRSASSTAGFLIEGGEQFAGNKNAMASLSTHVSGLRNRMGAAGKKMLEHARPLVIGAGVALGISAILSEPPCVLPPETSVAQKPSMKSGSGGENIPTNIHPADHVSGSPTPPDYSRFGNSARVAQGGYNAKIRGNTARQADYQNMNSQLGNSTGNSRTTTTLHDRRSSLTPQKLSSILRDG